MSKVRLYASFVEDFKRRPRDARQLHAAIEQFERTLQALAGNTPLPREAQARGLDPSDYDDRERMAEARRRAAGSAALDFATVAEAVAYLKKECGLSH